MLAMNIDKAIYLDLEFSDAFIAHKIDFASTGSSFLMPTNT
jgi:hypothetical protein